MAAEEANEAVKAEVVEETTSTESATEQTNSPNAEEAPDQPNFDDEDSDGDDWDDESTSEDEETVSEQADDESEDDGEDEPEPAPEDDEDEPTEEQPSDEPQTKADKRKEQLNSEIRDLVAERNRIRDEVEQANQEAYRVPTVEEAVEQINPETGDYYTRLEAEVAVMKQQQQLQRYNEQVAESRLTLRSEADRALREFPVFDENSPEYDEVLARQADELLTPNLIFDQNTNQLIGSRLSPYKVYKTLHDTRAQASSRSQAKAQKATEKMLASADPSSGAHHKPAPRDEGIDAFDEEADRW